MSLAACWVSKVQREPENPNATSPKASCLLLLLLLMLLFMGNSVSTINAQACSSKQCFHTFVRGSKGLVAPAKVSLHPPVPPEPPAEVLRRWWYGAPPPAAAAPAGDAIPPCAREYLLLEASSCRERHESNSAIVWALVGVLLPLLSALPGISSSAWHGWRKFLSRVSVRLSVMLA